MDVPSFAFLGFAAVAVLLMNCSLAHWWRRGVSVAANLGFIATFAHDWRALAPLGAFVAFGFGARKLVERRKGRPLFVLLVLLTIAALCWLRRYAFVPGAVLLPQLYVTVGVSYVFFRILHLIVDGYQDAESPRLSLASYLSYALSFTSFVSGPIQLYGDFVRTETAAPLALDAASIGSALERIVGGFFKAAALAQPLWLFEQWMYARTLVTANPERVLDAMLVLGAFPVYLYLNFSGYTDVVIGVARLMRIAIPENFDHPFASTGFMELWSRWHMSLSNWMKTYLYTPFLLALMRRNSSAAVTPYWGVLAYFVTFFVLGLWHGSTAMFAVYGLLLAAGVSANKLFAITMQERLGRKGYKALCAHPLYGAFSRALTYVWFALSLVWFWMTPAQVSAFAIALGPVDAALACLCLIALCAPILSAMVAIRTRAPLALARGARRSAPLRTAYATLLAIVLVTATVVFDAPAPAIVYKAF